MFKSKIFLKAMLIVTSVITVYTIVIYFLALPKIDESIQSLEEKNAKEILSKVVTLTNNVSKDLESFKKSALQRHKHELKSLTDTAWSIIQAKYEQSKPQNLHTVLRERGEVFKKNLINFYNANKDKMDEDELKKTIKNYTKIYRHESQNTGYFWINDLKANVIMHPINPELDGKSLINLKDPNGVHLFKEFKKKSNEDGSGIFKYQWYNPNSKKVENKISYAFTFHPFSWVFGTGDYYSVLKNRFQNDVIELVNKLRYADNNYFYISNYKNVLISHPYLQGKDLSTVKDVKGNLIVPPMIKIAKEKGEGFHSYWWKKNQKDDTPYEKLTYSKNFPDWDMVIGTGVYIDDIEKEVEKRKKELIQQMQQIIKTTKIGKTGYLYIFNGNGKMLIHPNTNLNNKNILKLRNLTKGTYLFDDLIKASRTTKELSYKWDKPTDLGNYIYDKISWIEYIPKLDWYIVSSAYVDEFNESSNNVRDFILLLALTIFIISALYSYLFLKKLLNPISNLSKLALKVSDGNYSIRSDIKRDDEIGLLSNEFNNMLEKIEDNIENLDKKVLEKTKEFEEQKEVFEKLFFGASDAIALLNGYHFIECNDSFVKLLKYKTKEEVCSLHPSEISPMYQMDGELSSKKASRLLYSCMKNGNVKFEWIHLKADGERFWAEVSLTIVKINNKKMLHAIWRDISETKKLEINLIEAKNKAEESVKSKSEFLANMSHEIRTPMNGIIGMSHLALQTNLNDKQKGFISRIDSSAKSLLGIINDILDFSKIEAGKLTIEKINFDLFQVIDGVINILEYKAHEKNLELVVDYDINIGKKFFGDSLRISQILTNLLSNAIKFTEYGEIKITVKTLQNNRVKFEIKDTGIGLSKEQQHKLFKSFSQADGSTTRKYGGTGLGLAISKQLVELMGGNIWVESELGHGSSFIFEIELIKEIIEENLFTIFLNKKVLVVDDNQSWQNILEYLLTSFGVDVDCTGSGKEAMKLMQNADNIYDLILMDWNMPDLDGIETTKLINENCLQERCPDVVLVSASKEDILLNKASEVGIKIFLQKPVNPSVLNDVLSDFFLGTSKANRIENIKGNTLKYDIQTLKGSKILLAEDNITNQEIVVGLLENSGINIDIANNGEEAIHLFNNSTYELVFMDLHMPIMDGYKATTIIRKLNKDIPIIALTANAMKEDIEKTQSVGINKHLNKPIDVEILYATLLEYISKKTDKINKKIVKKGDSMNLVEFEHIDKKYGLNLVLGDEEIFLNILKGLYKYKDINMENLADEEFQRAVHTLKGLSASAGALKLNKILIELDKTQDKLLLPKFYDEFVKVLIEIETKIINNQKTIKKIKLDSTKRDELFLKLKDAIATKRVHNTNPIMKEFEQYNLSQKDDELFQSIKILVDKFKFKQAMEIL